MKIMYTGFAGIRRALGHEWNAENEYTVEIPDTEVEVIQTLQAHEGFAVVKEPRRRKAAAAAEAGATEKEDS